MSRRIPELLVLAPLVLVACGGTSEDPPVGESTREQTLCSEMCRKGDACGFMAGCMTFEQCNDGCLREYGSVELSSACLDAIEAFHDCFWSSLSCDQILASPSGGSSCDSQLQAIGDPCAAGGSGFDKDRYVLIPLFCVYGPG